MNKQQLISRDNKEALGKFYLKKGVGFVLEKSYGKAYEFFKEGLDFLTCDCGTWRKGFVEADKSILEDLMIEKEERLEYYFVKGYLLSFEEGKKERYLGLDAIEKYLSERMDEYGLYVKGKILSGLEETSEALKLYSEALDLFGRNSRLLYRIGRIKEHHIKTCGLDELYNSFDINPSSACCARVLKKYMKEREIDIAFDDFYANPLIISFSDSNSEWEFDKLYEKYLAKVHIDDNLPFPQVEALPSIHTFIQFIRSNAGLFVVKNESLLEDDEQYDDSDDYFDDTDDYFDEPDYDEMYFDAMTDGQLGSYDDFKERGGNLDWVDDWAGQ